MKQIYSSLDIGSKSMKLVVGEVYKDKLHVLACSEIKSKGIKNGVIVNADETLICLKELFRRIEEILTIKIENVIVSIPAYYNEFNIVEGYTTITREDKHITGEDIVRALQSSIYNKIPLNREMINLIPIEFIIDDEEKVLDPKKLEARKLGVKAVVSTTPKKNVYGIITCLENIGVSVSDIALGALGDYYEFKKDEYKDKAGAVINIGHDKTEVSIINKNILIATEIIPLGGRHIDRDIAYIYNISKKSASDLKEKFALSTKTNASTSEIEEVLTKDNKPVKINQYEISEIVFERLKEILTLSKKQINLLTKKEISYIIVTGGTTEIADFKYMFSSIFGKIDINEVKEVGVRNNKYSTCLGLIKYYNEKLSFRDRISSTISDEKQHELFKSKPKKNINNSSVLGKIYGYFFDN